MAVEAVTKQNMDGDSNDQPQILDRNRRILREVSRLEGLLQKLKDVIAQMNNMDASDTEAMEEAIQVLKGMKVPIQEARKRVQDVSRKGMTSSDIVKETFRKP